MSEYNEKDYKLAKSVIKNAINKIIRDKMIKIGRTQIEVDISIPEEIKRAAEMLIISPLAYDSDEVAPNISEESKKQIQIVMNLFNEVYGEIYEECLSKEKNDFKEEIKVDSSRLDCSSEKTIQEKANDFNKMIRKQRNKIPIDYLRKMNQLKENKNTKQIQHIPIYKGEFNKEMPKKTDNGVGER